MFPLAAGVEELCASEWLPWGVGTLGVFCRDGSCLLFTIGVRRITDPEWLEEHLTCKESGVESKVPYLWGRRLGPGS